MARKVELLFVQKVGDRRAREARQAMSESEKANLEVDLADAAAELLLNILAAELVLNINVALRDERSYSRALKIAKSALLRRAIEEMELIRDGFQALAHVNFVRWLREHEAALKAELEKLEGS